MQTLSRLFKTKELRQSLLFVLLCLTIFRLGAHITLPGIDATSLSSFLAGNQFLGLLNLFSGGTLANFSILALGLGPYITASIIIQLLGMIFPSVEEMQKEEQGRQKLNSYTRYATFPLSILQGYSVIRLLDQSGSFGTSFDLNGLTLWTALISMAAGTIFLMWLGELISEKQVGNGTSIIIFAGIVAGLPSFLSQTIATYTSADLFDIVLFAILTLVTIAAVVMVQEAQRNIPVQYARGGGRTGAGSKVASHLPLRVSMGGMIPIMFALSIVVFPPLLAQLFANARTVWLQNAADFVTKLFADQWFYGIFYFLLVFIFTFFYASVIFRPEQIAENLQKQGGFIPGIRPGEPTAHYLDWVKNRILLVGAIFLSMIAILPIIVQGLTGSPNLVVGGSSVIIVVSVIVDMIKQVESQLTMREYDAI
jgi:preprotein translocase subunit SecY